VTGRVAKCEDDVQGETTGGAVAFGERRVDHTVNKEPLTGGGDLVNYNRPSLLTDV